MTDFVLRLQGGGIPAEVVVADPAGKPFKVAGTAIVRLNPLPVRNVSFTPSDGYWGVVIGTAGLAPAGSVPVVFPPLPASGPDGWWHQLHGLPNPQAEGAAAIRIGVIDEALEIQGADSCIAHVKNLAGVAWSPRNDARALTPLTDHGHAVCSILGSRANSGHGFAGVAPDAQIFFAAAGEDGSPKLDVPRLNACIDHLVNVCKCDIISVSAGDSPVAFQALEAELDDAADEGVLCFFAAGNRGRPLHPAVYPTCLAVAAVGQTGNAPPGTTVEWIDRNLALPLAPPVYLWRNSAHGPLIDFCAGGVGILWSRNGRAAQASFGTSFACPIVAGIAARVLAADPAFMSANRDRARYDGALQVLAAACRSFGGAAGSLYWKYGRIFIP